MSRICTGCSHPQRVDIDLAAMLHQRSYAALARQYGVTPDSVERHQRVHLRMSAPLSKGLGAMLSAENMLAKLSELDKITRDILDKSRHIGDDRLALSAVRASAASPAIGPATPAERDRCGDC